MQEEKIVEGEDEVNYKELLVTSITPPSEGNYLTEPLDIISQNKDPENPYSRINSIFSELTTEELKVAKWNLLTEWNTSLAKPMDKKSLRSFFKVVKEGHLKHRASEGDAEALPKAGKPRRNDVFYKMFVEEYGVAFFRDAKKDGYIQVKRDGTHKLLHSDSTELQDLYRDLFFEIAQSPLREGEVNESIEQLSAHARHVGKLIEPYLRVAKEGGTYYYDLANQACECVKIDATGWQIMSNPGLPFITSRLMSEQVHPVQGGDINDLFQFINIKDEDDRLLLIAAITACFIYGFSHPVLIIHGPKGSAKTSAMRLIKTLVDPSEVTSVPLTGDLKDLAVNFNSSWLVPFDNVSSISEEVSDALSKVVTGDSSALRRLFTDTELSVMKFQRCLIINGINNPVVKPDLLDRSILISIERIDESARMAETKLQEKRASLLPKLLGSLFDLTSHALAALPNVPEENLARLADFDLWGRAVSTALFGNPEPFMRAYAKNIDRQSQEAIGQSPFALTLIECLKQMIPDQGRIETTAGDLLKPLKDFRGDWGNEMPRSASSLARKINEISPDLINFGFRVSRRNTGRERLMIIERVKTKHYAPESSANTQEEPPKNLSPKEISSLLPSSSVADGIDATDSKK